MTDSCTGNMERRLDWRDEYGQFVAKRRGRQKRMEADGGGVATECLKAEIVVECGMGCGWTTELPWSNRMDSAPGQEGDTLPEDGDVFEGPITCPDCEKNRVAHSDLYRVVEVRNVRTIDTDADQ